MGFSFLRHWVFFEIEESDFKTIRKARKICRNDQTIRGHSIDVILGNILGIILGGY